MRLGGEGGHNATLAAACECFRRGLSVTEAWEVMRRFSAEKCWPAWTDKELQHKLDDAQKKVAAAGGKGMRLLEEREFRSVPAPARDPITITPNHQTDIGNAERLIAEARRPPPRSEARNIAQRFREHGDAYFRFMTTPDVEPTNNLAEQAIRFVVIDRKVTQGTRSEAGRRWSERIWTALAACAQQGSFGVRVSPMRRSRSSHPATRSLTARQFNLNDFL